MRVNRKNLKTNNDAGNSKNTQVRSNGISERALTEKSKRSVAGKSQIQKKASTSLEGKEGPIQRTPGGH